MTLGALARRLKLALAEALYRLGVVDLLLHFRRRRPLVLRYHRIYGDDERPFYQLGVTRSVFEAQLEFLRRRFEVVPLGRIYDGLFDGGRLPDGAVAITFDDGYRDNFVQALPALRARGLAATLFISAGSVEEEKPFWWDRLASAVVAAPSGPVAIDLGAGAEAFELDGLPSRRALFDRVREAVKRMPHADGQQVLGRLASALCPGVLLAGEPLLSWAEAAQMEQEGFAIESHGLDHPVLARVPAAEAERQICESRRLLEARLGKAARFFSYPNGKRDDVTPELCGMVQRAGYRGALSTIEGRPSRRSDPYLLERIGMSMGMTTDARGAFSEALFATELSGLYDVLFMRRRRDRALH